MFSDADHDIGEHFQVSDEVSTPFLGRDITLFIESSLLSSSFVRRYYWRLTARSLHFIERGLTIEG